MKREELRIVFMGTPVFAVESLRALITGGYNIAGVITAPDKPAGRHGSALQSSAVKQYAVSQNIPVLQPERLKDETFLYELRLLKADLQIVVAFRMLPGIVWDMPRFGTFNLHASLLPQYRGAAPINRAVMNGDRETGSTTFFITHEIDTGRIIKQEKVPIDETDDAGIVHDKLMNLGGKLVTETVDLIIENNGNVNSIPQEQLFDQYAELRPAPKIFKETCRINWNQPAEKIYDFIRGLSPYPAAWTELVNPDGEIISLKIFQSEISGNKASGREPAGTAGFEQPAATDRDASSIGTIVTDSKSYIEIAAKKGFVNIKSLQLAGKKRMNISDFLNGTKLNNHWKVQ
jgi:methionyl-tRNA formyltransferase